MTMTTTAATMTEPAQAARQGSRVTARWRIVAWLMLALVIAMTALIVTVRSAMIAEVGRNLNADVVQENQEFRTFAGEGRNPETARPFTDVSSMFEVMLRRQRAAEGEMLVGYVPARQQALTVEGVRTPSLAEAGLEPGSREFGQLLTGPRSGIVETRGGDARFVRDEVTLGGERGVFLVLAFERHHLQEVDSTVRLMVGVAAGALLLAAAIAWLAAGQILRPVRSVRRAAAEITERDLTRRIPVQGNDDIAELAVTFNGMLDRLEAAFAAEQRFVDDAAHELRTPITIIRGHLETMSDDPAERAATTTLVLNELSRMSRIVSDLLALAKAERPDFIHLAEPVDLAELTLDIDAKMQALGPRRWTLAEVADGPAVVDAQRVTQAVLQLAQNAVEHTGDGDLIELASRFVRDPELGDAVAITVRDDGPGVAAEDAELIFDRFARGAGQSASGARSRAGAGLGLAIVRAIAEGHRGSVTLESRPGAGSTFGLLLPVGEVPATRDADELELFEEIDDDREPAEAHR